MRIRSGTVTVILALAFGAVGCAGSLAHLRPEDGARVICPGPRVGPPVEVTYLRTAGVLFRRGTRDVVMTAPFYSNPSLLAVGSDGRSLPTRIGSDDISRGSVTRRPSWSGTRTTII
jgi:hypothetical protein